MLRILYATAIIILPVFAFAQTDEPHATKNEEQHFSSLNEYFQHGHFTAHTRSYYMHTLNEGSLTDFYALTTGAGIGYESPSYKGFGFALNGFFIFRVASSPLAEADPATGKRSRYELQLLDVTHPENGEDLDRLEEAYLYYKKKQLEVHLGRVDITTPFINPQNSRMRPSLEEGLVLTDAVSEHLRFTSAWLWAMSPRSTILWYPEGQSIGLYGQGRTLEGEPGNYRFNTTSKGIGLLGLDWKQKQSYRGGFWATYIENVSHTLFLEHQQYFKLGLQRFSAAAQLTYQHRVGNGGNSNPALRYMESDRAEAVSARLAWHGEKTTLQLNYTRITSSGRFLFPREWGTEPFYTYLSRERNEGNGNVHAISANYLKNTSATFNFEVSAGWYSMPASSDLRLNKFGLDDYLHFVARTNYHPKGVFEGFEIIALALLKKDVAGQRDPSFLINQANMLQFNLIVDYYFGRKHS